MSLQSAQWAARQLRAPSAATLAALSNALSSFRISSPTTSLETRRNASHQAQGRANGAKDGPGKRLGAKKTAGQYVVPGSILYRQRGTLWFPGEGCFMGRDHTIHAKVPGYVQYYLDPQRHRKHKFIGVVFEKHQRLPAPPNAPRRRQLGMLAYQMPAAGPAEDGASVASSPPADLPVVPKTVVVKSERPGVDGKTETVETTLTMSKGYGWRQANWEIGRDAKKSAAALSVKPHDPSDRFGRWRRKLVRRKEREEQRALRNAGKKGKKAKK